MLPQTLGRQSRRLYLKNFPTTSHFSNSAVNCNKTTIVDKEIKHFKKFDQGWWDEMGVMKPLHSMNMLRVPFVRDGLINTNIAKQKYVNTATPLTDTTILDVGCAGGILTEALSRLGAKMTGIDATEELIEQARFHSEKMRKINNSSLSDVSYVCTTIEKHAEKNAEKYDAVVASEVLEHVQEKMLFLQSCANCVKPGGSIFITTLNKTTLAWFGAIIMAEYVLRIVPMNTHNSDMFIEPHRVQKILEDNNCQTKVLHGMAYNFLTNRWCWVSNTDISYALHVVKRS